MAQTMVTVVWAFSVVLLVVSKVYIYNVIKYNNIYIYTSSYGPNHASRRVVWAVLLSVLRPPPPNPFLISFHHRSCQ